MSRAEYRPLHIVDAQLGDEDITGEVTDDLPVAVLCEVPELMDMESVRPRFQAINGPLNEAAIRVQLEEAHHPLHRAMPLQNGHCCPQILCKVLDTQPHAFISWGRAWREPHRSFTLLPQAFSNPKSPNPVVRFISAPGHLPPREARPRSQWLLTQETTAHALEYCLPPRAF